MKEKKLISPCHCINTRRAASAVTAYYDQMLAPCNLSVGQFSLLWNLDTIGESSVTKLADNVGLERSTVVRNLKPLIEGGYIKDSAQDNSRARKLVVTAKGKAVVAKGVPLWKQAQKKIYNTLGTENTEIFRNIMATLQHI